VQWTVGCEKNNAVIPSKSYKKTVKFPAIVKVKFTKSSSTCTVAANVQLDGSGKVTISLESSG
jgi:carbamoylphosphate synthase large subunit